MKLTPEQVIAKHEKLLHRLILRIVRKQSNPLYDDLYNAGVIYLLHAYQNTVWDGTLSRTFKSALNRELWNEFKRGRCALSSPEHVFYASMPSEVCYDDSDEFLGSSIETGIIDSVVDSVTGFKDSEKLPDQAMQALDEGERTVFSCGVLLQEPKEESMRRLGINEATYDVRMKSAMRTVKRALKSLDKPSAILSLFQTNDYTPATERWVLFREILESLNPVDFSLFVGRYIEGKSINELTKEFRARKGVIQESLKRLESKLSDIEKEDP